MYKLDLEKAEEPEIKSPTSVGSITAKEFQKNIYFCFIDYAKASDCVDDKKLWKISKRWEYQTTWPYSWETCMQVKKQQFEPDINNGLAQNWQEYIKAIYCHPAYLTSMETTSCEISGWIK